MPQKEDMKGFTPSATRMGRMEDGAQGASALATDRRAQDDNAKP